jgi:hypothetical protein
LLSFVENATAFSAGAHGAHAKAAHHAMSRALGRRLAANSRAGSFLLEVIFIGVAFVDLLGGTGSRAQA